LELKPRLVYAVDVVAVEVVRTLAGAFDSIAYTDCLAVFEVLGVAFADAGVIVVG